MGVKRDWYVSFYTDEGYKQFMVYNACKEEVIDKAVKEGYVIPKWYERNNTITLIDFDVNKLYSGEEGINFNTVDNRSLMYKVLNKIDSFLRGIKAW